MQCSVLIFKIIYFICSHCVWPYNRGYGLMTDQDNNNISSEMPAPLIEQRLMQLQSSQMIGQFQFFSFISLVSIIAVSFLYWNEAFIFLLQKPLNFFRFYDLDATILVFRLRLHIVNLQLQPLGVVPF